MDRRVDGRLVLDGLLAVDALVLEKKVQSPPVGWVGVFKVGTTDVAPIPMNPKTRGVLIGQTAVINLGDRGFLGSTHDL
jgi:hypothetical protein